MLVEWLTTNAGMLAAWAGALSTFAIYSILYRENRFYRLFEHIFIGLSAGYGVYITWSNVLGPKWWGQIFGAGRWYWVFAAVIGSMFYFLYSRKHAWISRVIFGLFMGLAAGGMFREFYETYFPQMGSSMKPIAGTAGEVFSVLVFYAILIASMVYFFFSFEHKGAAISKTAAAGRWFLMIGFGAIFGATVMGRMTLFIGRFNFLINTWLPEAGNTWRVAVSSWYGMAVLAVLALAVVLLIAGLTRPRKTKLPPQGE